MVGWTVVVGVGLTRGVILLHVSIDQDPVGEVPRTVLYVSYRDHEKIHSQSCTVLRMTLSFGLLKHHSILLKALDNIKRVAGPVLVHDRPVRYWRCLPAKVAVRKSKE